MDVDYEFSGPCEVLADKKQAGECQVRFVLKSGPIRDGSAALLELPEGLAARLNRARTVTLRFDGRCAECVYRRYNPDFDGVELECGYPSEESAK